MTKFSLTYQQIQQLTLDTTFLDPVYTKIPLRQRQWHVDQNAYEIAVCDTCDTNPRRWDIAKKSYGRFCSSKCAHNHPDVKTQTQKTCMDRFGAITNLISESGKAKTQKTLNERYGVDHPARSADIQLRKKTTLIENYGVSSTLQLPQAQLKTMQTNMDRYGVGHHWSAKDVKDKIRRTNIVRYGVENPSQSSVIQQKKRRSLENRYGVSNVAQIEYSDLTRNILFDKFKFKEYIDKKSLMDVANALSVDRTTIINYAIKYNCADHFKANTYIESELCNILNSLNIQYIQNCRTLISPYEIDIYIPEYNLAIEMNGDYWHSDKFRDYNYHQQKWIKCNQAGIRLIQISESDWNNHSEKFINLLIGVFNRKEIGDAARKCSIRKISAKESRIFMGKYHLQGFVIGTSYWGAFDRSNQMVGSMTFGWTRGSKTSRRFELKRWSLDGKSHAGLFSRTFIAAQRQLGFNTVVSFSTNDWFTGDVYRQFGFKENGVTRPAYTYIFKGTRYHASHFTKQRISKQFPEIFDQSLTEKEMMCAVGAHRVWDSGKIEWIWECDVDIT